MDMDMDICMEVKYAECMKRKREDDMEEDSMKRRKVDVASSVDSKNKVDSKKYMLNKYMLNKYMLNTVEDICKSMLRIKLKGGNRRIDTMSARSIKKYII
jgi:hypothetical protein